MAGRKPSVAEAALEASSIDGLPNAVSVITQWSRPFGDDDGSAEYFWAVVTWWVKFGAVAYGGSIPQFLKSLPSGRFVEQRTEVALPSGKSISVPTALALINPPEWEGFSTKAGHTIFYSVPDYDLFDLVFRDPPFVRAAILAFDVFVEWLVTLPKSPNPIPLLARYVAELVVRQPAEIEVAGIEASFRSWISHQGQSGDAEAIDRVFSEVRARRVTDECVKTSFATAEAKNDVDVYGHFGKPLGIGEDARLIARAFETAGFRVNRINLDTQIELGEPTTTVGFWALPAPNFALRALRFTPAHDAQIKVIATPWELPETPSCLHWVYRAADLICVYSDFVCKSLPRDVGEKAIKIPMPFDCAAVDVIGRTTAKADLFTFIVVFDFWSYPQRKGPHHAIAAFKQAFGPADPVRLVVKSIHSAAMPERLAVLKQVAGDDPRITFIDSELSPEEVLRLVAQAHVLLSLHASEGFGRVLAESMLLNTLVIGTDYSGSREICRRDTALRVPYELVPISHLDYLFGDGQHWAKPDVGVAAGAMKSAFCEWTSSELVGMRQRARELVRTKFSLEATARTLSWMFQERLRLRAGNGESGASTKRSDF